MPPTRWRRGVLAALPGVAVEDPAAVSRFVVRPQALACLPGPLHEAVLAERSEPFLRLPDRSPRWREKQELRDLLPQGVL